MEIAFITEVLSSPYLLLALNFPYLNTLHLRATYDRLRKKVASYTHVHTNAWKFLPDRLAYTKRGVDSPCARTGVRWNVGQVYSRETLNRY